MAPFIFAEFMLMRLLKDEAGHQKDQVMKAETSSSTYQTPLEKGEKRTGESSIKTFEQ